MRYSYPVIPFQKAIITSKFSVWLISSHGTIYFTPFVLRRPCQLPSYSLTCFLSTFTNVLKSVLYLWCLADRCVPQCSSSISGVFSFVSPASSGVVGWIWICLLDLTDFWFWPLFAWQPENMPLKNRPGFEPRTSCKCFICYFSNKFSMTQRMIEKEILSLLLSLQYFEVYISCSALPVIIFSDHYPLFLNCMKNSDETLMCWSCWSGIFAWRFNTKRARIMSLTMFFRMCHLHPSWQILLSKMFLRKRCYCCSRLRSYCSLMMFMCNNNESCVFY